MRPRETMTLLRAEKTYVQALPAMLNAPNRLTALRIALIPLLVAAFYLPYEWAYAASTLVFAFGGLTDWLDGFLARRLGQESSFGAFLDPVADKLMVTTAMILLAVQSGSAILAVPAIIIISREIAVSALREWMAQTGRSAVVSVAYPGKIKTLTQMLALVMLLYGRPIGGIPTSELGTLLLYVAAAFAVWSMAIYFHAAFFCGNREQGPERS
jgi:CDP-diacylglycerol---glycerol-3-phosphate 3-phosphatidyltransferase